MAHISENSKPLEVSVRKVSDLSELDAATRGFGDVCVLMLTQEKEVDYSTPSEAIASVIKKVAQNLSDNAVLAVIGEIGDLVESISAANGHLRYQQWIAIKRGTLVCSDKRSLPHQHIGLLILSKYSSSLRHTKTRIRYSYCPVCDKTSKDYGGKKHTYHELGTLISDVWRDLEYRDDDPDPVILRLADFFGLPEYAELRVLDLRTKEFSRTVPITERPVQETRTHDIKAVDQLHNDDCLERLRKLPSNSVDFAFADPPYNLKKKYNRYSDDMDIIEYFKWCDEWLAEMGRVIKPGRTVALLNIPLWSVRHFQYLSSALRFQNWIVWDALSYPVRLIMPAHYTILCFSKGVPRELPGLTGESAVNGINGTHQGFQILRPMGEGYCLRSACLEKRRRDKIDDRGELTDVWWDIHRLKHNTRRVDHPTQLPPQLLYRLISVFTKPGELVLDCFNGSGTTTLAAEQLGRSYLGIEKSKTYHKLATQRHQEIKRGLDPFRKAVRKLTAKNSPVPRLMKQKYLVPKKVLQLEVKRIAKKLARLPNREEVIHYGKYPIKFYDNYFVSWGEVCAAARTTGMTENRIPKSRLKRSDASQLDLNLTGKR